MKFKQIPFRPSDTNCVKCAYANLFNDTRFLDFPETENTRKNGFSIADEIEMMNEIDCDKIFQWTVVPRLIVPDMQSPAIQYLRNTVNTIDNEGFFIPCILSAMHNTNRLHAIAAIYDIFSETIIAIDHLKEFPFVADDIRVHGIHVFADKTDTSNIIVFEESDLQHIIEF